MASTVQGSSLDVDLDLYGRGFDGIFGRGAEQVSRHEAMRSLKLNRDRAMASTGQRRMSFIERDYYGRGDPRVFGAPPTANTTQSQHEAVPANTQRPGDDARRMTITKVPCAFLIPSGLLGRISCFSAPREKSSLSTLVPLEPMSSSSSSSLSSSPFSSPTKQEPIVTELPRPAAVSPPNKQPSLAPQPSMAELPRPTAVSPTTKQPSLAPQPSMAELPRPTPISPTNKQPSLASQPSMAGHAVTSIASSSHVSKQTSFRHIGSSIPQTRSGSAALVQRVRSARPGESETVVIEQGHVARLVHSLHSSGILSPRNSRCVSNIPSFDAFYTAEQTTHAEMSPTTPQEPQNPNPFRNDSANISDSSSSDPTPSTSTPSSSHSTASSPGTKSPKSKTSPDASPFNSPSASHSPSSQSNENSSCAAKSASLQYSSTLPSALRSASTSSPSSPATNSSATVRTPSRSSQTPSPFKLSFSDRSESSSAAATPSSPVLSSEHTSTPTSSSPSSQATTADPAAPSSRLNSRIKFTSKSSDAVDSSKSDAQAVSSSNSDSPTKTHVTPRAFSFHPGSADEPEPAPIATPASSAAKSSGSKRRVGIFQRVRSLFGTSKSSSAASHPSSAILLDPARSSSGTSGNGTGPSAYDPNEFHSGSGSGSGSSSGSGSGSGSGSDSGSGSGSHSGSGSGQTSSSSASPSTGIDSDEMSMSSKRNSTASASKNSRTASSTQESHERQSVPSETGSPSGSEDRDHNGGLEGMKVDTDIDPVVGNRSTSSSNHSQKGAESAGSEKDSSSSSPGEDSDDIISAPNSGPESGSSVERIDDAVIDPTSPVHLDNLSSVEAFRQDQDEVVLTNTSLPDIVTVSSMPLAEETDPENNEWSREATMEDADENQQDGERHSSGEAHSTTGVSDSGDTEMVDSDAVESAPSPPFIDSDDSIINGPSSSALLSSSLNDSGSDTDDSANAAPSSELLLTSSSGTGLNSDDFTLEEQTCSTSLERALESSVEADSPSSSEMASS